MFYAFSVPIFGLVLAFVGLVIGLSVGPQRNEIAVKAGRLIAKQGRKRE